MVLRLLRDGFRSRSPTLRPWIACRAWVLRGGVLEPAKVLVQHPAFSLGRGLWSYVDVVQWGVTSGCRRTKKGGLMAALARSRR
jgi:hypothetical protein